MLRYLPLAISLCGLAFIAKRLSGHKDQKKRVTRQSDDALRERLRQEFPSLVRSEVIFFENAGGSQVPKSVADAIHHYYLNNYVQLGAGYSLANIATETVEAAHSFISLFMNGSEGRVILGPSSSALVTHLANSFRELLTAEDEIIVSDNSHEANYGPWVRLAKKTKATLKHWLPDQKTAAMNESELEKLLTPKTKLVALTHVSNLLGEVLPVKQIISMIRRKSPEAKVIADGVAYAPHRQIDVKDWDIDFYFYSTYKVYGPHMAALYGKKSAFQGLDGPNWDFIPKESAYKWEVGGCLHEGCAGLLELRGYINTVLGRPVHTEVDRDAIVQAFTIFDKLEKPLTSRLISYLNSKSPTLRIIGPTDPDSPSRVPTISFVHTKMKSSAVVKHLHKAGIGTRNGDMYAVSLCKTLGIDEEGVVRISLLHYNTLEEVEHVTKAIDQLV